MSMKTRIGSTAAAAVIALAPAEVEADFLNVEIMAAQDAVTLDVTVQADLGERTGVLARTRARIDYKGEASTFALADLNYNLGVPGLDAVLETQFAGGVILRVGLQYFHSTGDFSLLLLGTASVSEDPDGEFLAILQYAPEIHDELRLPMRLEALTSVGEEGHNFSVQRLRLGLETHGVEFGAAADLQELGNEGEFSYSVGGYIRLTR
jgi:hypothetical protein